MRSHTLERAHRMNRKRTSVPLWHRDGVGVKMGS